MQNNTLTTITDSQAIDKILANWPLASFVKFAKLHMSYAGVQTEEQANKQLESRYNEELFAIPLSDWCKDTNNNRNTVFATLKEYGFIDDSNRITQTYIDTIHNPDEDEETPFNDLVIFNTHLTPNGTYTLMIRPSSPLYNEFIDLLELKNDYYRGSKDITRWQLQHIHRGLNIDFSGVEL